MTIKTGVSDGTIDILAADTTIYEVPTGERIKATSMSCHSTAVATVSFYRSPDSTSTHINAKLIDVVTFAIGDTKSITSIINQGYAFEQNIIAIADVVGVNATMTRTDYTGDDV